MRGERFSNTAHLVTLPLSKRWARIYCASAAGLTDKETAARLGLAESTIGLYTTKIRKAMGFHTKNELQAEIIKKALAGDLTQYLYDVLGANAGMFSETFKG